MDQVSDLEFNGPFPDWWNVVDDFGADPTGASDSTTAFQNMLDAMATETTKDGVYLGKCGYVPSGTYHIHDTLTLPRSDAYGSGLNMSIWGQDPATTILEWHGDNGPAMLWSDGCNNLVIGRLTFDGQSAAHAGVRQERNPDISLQNTGSRLQDCIFKDLQYGFIETSDESSYGLDSEFSILRCEFYRCTQQAVFITKPESYNYWVRQCYFEDCNIGISNGPSGAFSAYDNVFVRSVVTDIYATSMRVCGIRRNSSFNSNRFLYLASCAAVVEGNNIYHSTQTDTIQMADRFKVMLANNKIQSLPEVTSGPVINELTNQYDAETLSPFSTLFVLFNQFTVTDPISITPNTPTSTDIQGNLLSPAMALTQPALPPHPPQIIRKTFIINVQDEDPQITVDAAAAYAIEFPGSEPVIYLPRWNFSEGYTIGQTIVFPANLKMSLQGNQSYFKWGRGASRDAPDPFCLFRGPSKLTIMNIILGSGYDTGDKHGLIALFDNCDQVGGRVYMDNSTSAYRFVGLSETKADICDHSIVGSNEENTTLYVGGLGEKTGPARVLQEGGAGGGGSEDTLPKFQVEDGGRLYLREFWFETNSTDVTWGVFSGMGAQPGKVTIESSFIEQHNSPLGWKMKMMEVTDWRGDILYISDQIAGGTQLNGEASRTNFLSFAGSGAILAGSATPATMYRQDGPRSYLEGPDNDNAGWGVFGTKPIDWKERLWDTFTRAPTVWVNDLGAGVTDIRMIRAGGDATFMAGTYTIQGNSWPVSQTTDFSNGVMPADTAFSRASEASRIDDTGLMIFEPENIGRFTYDPVTHALQGFLNEPTGTNLILTSEDLSSSKWFRTENSIDPAAGVTAPDGGANGNQNTEFAGWNGHFTYTERPLSYASTPFSVSFYVQPVERQYACITSVISGTNYFAVLYDTVGLTNGEILNGTPADDTILSTAILAAGNDWCRCILSGEFLAPGSTNLTIEIGAAPTLTGNTFDAGGQLRYMGDGTSRINIWGAQAELGGVSSYIRNTSSTAPGVRATDTLKLFRANGTYDMVVTRQDGDQNYTGQVVTDGTLLVPTSLSPLLKVVTTRTA